MSIKSKLKNTNYQRLTEIPKLFKDSFFGFLQKDGLFHGAALAYYALFALVPLLYLSVSFIGRFIGQDLMLKIIEDLLKNKVGIQDVGGLMDFIRQLNFDKGNFFLEMVSIFALLIASSAFVVCLKQSINTFFGIELHYSTKRKQFVSTLIFRLLSVVYIGVITIFIIVLYFTQTIVLSFSAYVFEDSTYFSYFISGILQHGFGIFSNVAIFTLVFKYVHDGFIKWKLAISGALVTSVMLYVGQLFIQYYLSHFFFLANGGFAGTLFIILAWVYYSSQIIFFGAKFTSSYARLIGEPIEFKE
jgi:membrane protein